MLPSPRSLPDDKGRLVHSHITLVLGHEEDHDHPLPLVELHRGGDREARISFRESDEESTRLFGCPECVANLLRGTANLIEDMIHHDRWLEDLPGSEL